MGAVPAAPPRIKICGLTRLDDAEHAVDAGAWAIGLIFFPGSRRAVALEPAREIARRLRRRVEIAPTGVTGRRAGTGAQVRGREGPHAAADLPVAARRTATGATAARAWTAGPRVWATVHADRARQPSRPRRSRTT